MAAQLLEKVTRCWRTGTFWGELTFFKLQFVGITVFFFEEDNEPESMLDLITGDILRLFFYFLLFVQSATFELVCQSCKEKKISPVLYYCRLQMRWGVFSVPNSRQLHLGAVECNNVIMASSTVLAISQRSSQLLSSLPLN